MQTEPKRPAHRHGELSEWDVTLSGVVGSRMPAVKRPAHRPAQYPGEPMETLSLRLPARLKAKAIRIGKGSAAECIRDLIEQAKEAAVNSMENFYDSVYRNDNAEGNAHGWIQWKGTDVCVDLYCACGHHGHYDGDFLYYYECPACKSKYALGQVIKLIPLTDEEAKHVETEDIGFKTCNEHDHT